MVRKDVEGCKPLEELYDDKKVKISQIAKVGTMTAYFVEIASNLKKTPCDYLKTKYADCKLIAKGVKEKDGVWDW